MLETLRAGDRVRSGRQPERGIGKVVYADASSAVVYFKDRTKTEPSVLLGVVGRPSVLSSLHVSNASERSTVQNHRVTYPRWRLQNL